MKPSTIINRVRAKQASARKKEFERAFREAAKQELHDYEADINWYRIFPFLVFVFAALVSCKILWGLK